MTAIESLPFNSAAHADARGSAAVWTRRRARAGGCERSAAQAARGAEV